MLTPIRGLINFVLALIEFFLGMRFILKILGANSSAPFVGWIYETTNPILEPFKNIFPSAKISTFTIDFTTLFALFVYMFIGYLLIELISYIEYSARNRRQ